MADSVHEPREKHGRWQKTSAAFLGLGVVCLLLVFPRPHAESQDMPAVAPSSADEEQSAERRTGKIARIHGALAALADPAPEVQSLAFSELRALHALDRMSSEHLDLLAGLLRHPQPDLQISALSVLRDLGTPAAEAVVPQIAALLTTDDPAVRAAAVRALGKLAHEWKDEYVPQLVTLLEDSDSSVRLAVVQAVNALDPEGQTTLPFIQQRLKSSDAAHRSEALLMLEASGELAEAAIPDIVQGVKDPEAGVRRTALGVLGRLGVPDARAIFEVAACLTDQRAAVRIAAARSVCRLMPFSSHELSGVLALLDDAEADVRIGALNALASLSPDELTPYRAAIVAQDADPDPNVRAAVIDVIGRLGEAANPAQDDFLRERLQDDSWEVRAAAARALGHLGLPENDLHRLLEPLLHDADWYVRSSALKALGAHISPESFKSSLLRTALRDDDGSVRAAALWVLGNWEEQAAPYFANLLDALPDPHLGVQQAAQRAIRNLGRVTLPQFLEFLDQEVVRREGEAPPEIRFLLHVVGAGEQTAEALIRWLAQPVGPDTWDTLTLPQARAVLRAFEHAVTSGAKVPATFERIAGLSSRILLHMQPAWSSRDLALLSSQARHVRAYSAYGDSVRQVLWRVRWRWVLSQPLVPGATVAMIHPLLWLILWILAPSVRNIRVYCFWNPYVRWGLGLGYVHVLVLKIPAIRNRLLRPYRKSLLIDADMAHFDEVVYEKDVSVFDVQTRQYAPIHEAIQALRGKIVVEGEAGLGKTTFVRYLLKQCRRPVAYLPAAKCTDGVAAAVLMKLQGECHDEAFVRALLCEGAVDLCVDGLDTVSAKNRARLYHFLLRTCRGNVLLTTRPTSTMAHRGCSTYILQPLPRERIEDFLRAWYRMLPPEVPTSRAEYVIACGNYVQRVCAGRPNDSDLAALTNPLKLTLIALVCAHGATPDVGGLMKQCFEIIEADYRRQNDDQPFPLRQFSERVYRMRLNDEGNMPKQRFESAIETMVRYGMIVKRRTYDLYGTLTEEYVFRHEMIADFFLLHAFLEKNSHRIERHVGDSCFDGVYALLQDMGYAPDAGPHLHQEFLPGQPVAYHSL